MADLLSRLTDALKGRYDVEREIGHGGMATVFRARDLRHHRLVAIKVLHPDLAAAVGGDRFLREIQIAAQLQHPHILTLIDSGEGNGLLYYVMPFVEGVSLRDKVSDGKPLAISETLRILRDVVDALAYAHRHDVVHRDVKPDNVMLADRHALVVDFGVAKAMRDAKTTHALTSIGVSLGTPAYMAPEQAAADPAADHRVDIYATGVLAYELLAGRPPFVGAPQQVLAAQISTEPEPIAKLRPDVPPGVARIVMKCLEKEPRDRYQTADELRDELEALTTPGTGTQPAIRMAATPEGRRRFAGVVIVALLVIFVLGWTAISRSRKQRWVRDVAVPELRHLSEITGAADIALTDSSWKLAQRAARIAPDQPSLVNLMRLVTGRAVPQSEPAGAEVYRARYDDSTSWTRVGLTGTDTLVLPSGFSRYRFEKAGYRPATIVATPAILRGTRVKLDTVSAPDSEMVNVTGGDEQFAGVIGLDYEKPVALAPYKIDRYETTNAEYKRFVDAGGYTNKKFWTEPLVRNGKPISWEDAMRLFVDRTGRPGPATWEGGAPAEGQGNVAVGGLSWYEAAAYAKFAHKQLPTVFHWARAAGINLAQYIVPPSNFGAKAARAGSTFAGMSAAGAFDMAGNVREWCSNAFGNRRYVLGGGWSDEEYQFTDAYAQDPMDRSVINGVRLMNAIEDEAALAPARRQLVMHERDYTKEKPAPDILFQSYRRMFDYDASPLGAKVASRDTTAEDWIVERVSFAAAYGQERMPAVLMLPKHHPPPYQVVVFFPGSNAIHISSSNTINPRTFDYLLRSGRAVIHPIYKSTYERRDSLNTDYADETNFYRDHVLMWGKDLRRSVDYLATRADIDTSKIAYYGISWGGYLGGIMPAIEPRIKVTLLYVAGLSRDRAKPEVEPMNYLPRIKMPVLMLNGKYDYFFPMETAQKPFFRLLGSPPDKKRYVVYEGGHNVPRERLITESLDWLDKYLGKPR